MSVLAHMGKGSFGSHLYVSSYQEEQKRVIPSYLASAIDSAISQGRISCYRTGGMFQLKFIGAISNPKLINKQKLCPRETFWYVLYKFSLPRE